MDEAVSLDVEGSLARLVVPDGPWTRRSVLAIDQHLRRLEEEPGPVRVVLLSGAPEGFCVGAAPGGSVAAGVDPPGRLTRLRQPVVACLEGPVRSLGLSLVLGADFRIAAPGATFSLSGAAGSSGPPLPAWGAVSRLTRLTGPGQAAGLVLLDETIDANTALRVGLVHEVTQDPGGRALELARQLGQRAPIALEYAKEAVWRGVELPLAHALRLEADFNHLLQTSADRAEGLTAFFEKRLPRFEDR
jgi:enoyl-CoA hydratase/carnithine racemase